MKPYFLSVLLTVLLGMSSTFAQPTFEPVNPNATKEAKKLLKYLYKIRGAHIISGHHNYPHRLTDYTARLTEITGEVPALWGSDLSLLRGDTRQNVIEEAIRQHQKGSIVTIMWHAGRPHDPFLYGWKSSVQAEFTDEQWQELTTPGTEMNGQWQEKVDNMAFWLRKLQEAKVPVLWRPYHEMNGIWFWWGDRKGEEGFAKLWKMLYERLTHHHKINNLIWVWNANAPRDRENDEAYAYELYYPGHQYVDVLAADVYHNDYRQSHHDQLLELGEGRLIALGEVGGVPTPETLQDQPMWAWFMIWTDWVDKANTPEKVRALYQYPKTLNRSEIKPTW